MGYVDDLEKTKESVDEDGWLHTGDLGKIDPQCGLFITGRLKVFLIPVYFVYNKFEFTIPPFFGVGYHYYSRWRKYSNAFDRRNH